MLRLSHVSKTFSPGTANEKKAMDDFSLEVEDGEFVSIIGANGAGKSTLFNAIAGSFITDEGAIELDGEDITLTAVYGAETGTTLERGSISGKAVDAEVLGLQLAEQLRAAYERNSL